MVPKSKEKGKASTPSQSPPAFEDLFTTLDRHIQRSEYEQVVKVADQVLSIAPANEDAIQCKVVALVKDDKIDEAISVIDSFHKLPIDLGFQKAYCLYRQNKLDEAFECLRDREKDSETSLRKQMLALMCIAVYRTPRLKLQRSISWPAWFQLVKLLKCKERWSLGSSFELAFNTACSLIENNNYADAEQLLLAAMRYVTVYSRFFHHCFYKCLLEGDKCEFDKII